MEKLKEESKKGMCINLRGEVLKAAIALRHKHENELGKVVSITDIVNNAITQNYKRECTKESDENE